MDSAKNKVYNERNNWDPFDEWKQEKTVFIIQFVTDHVQAIVYLFLIDPTLIKKTFKDFLWVSSFFIKWFKIREPETCKRHFFFNGYKINS